jgi:hypothetical protein
VPVKVQASAGEGAGLRDSLSRQQSTDYIEHFSSISGETQQ